MTASAQLTLSMNPWASTSATEANIAMHVLGSGSKGNATLVQNVSTGKAILIDCGICKRDFLTRCEEVNFDIHNLEAILITHEHTDHTKGLGVVLRGLAKKNLHPQLYVSRNVRAASKEIYQVEELCTVKSLACEAQIDCSGLTIYPFATSHDSSESFGFRIQSDKGDSLGYITDSGIAGAQAMEHLRDCRILALESNHDEKMLKDGDYPYFVKKRIASDEGHLSNTQAATVLEKLLSDKLEHIVAMHISENNNTYRLPGQILQEVVSRNTHAAQVEVAYQYMRVSVQ